MTIYTPNWMQGGSYAAHIDRWNGAAELWDEGVLDPLSLKVTQRGAGANISVDVAAGDAVVTGDDQARQGNYRVVTDAVVNVTLAAVPGSNSRYDIIILQINDPDAGGAAGSNAVITKVTGTAAASPTVPATPNSAILLATVGPITSATSSITNSIIVDSRILAGRRDIPGTLAPTAAGAFANFVPNGWRLCDGSAVSRTTFAKLFAMIGTLYGVGDGSTTFNLPNPRDRVVVAAGSTFTAGGFGGAVSHSITQGELPNISLDPPSTTVTITDPGHVHATEYKNGGHFSNVGTGGGLNTLDGGFTGVTPSATTGITAAVDLAPIALGGSGTAVSLMQPYQVIAAYLIRT